MHLTHQLRRTAVAALMLALPACTSMVDVDSPTNIVAQDDIATQAGAVAKYQGAIATFAAMYGGGNAGTKNVAVYDGLLSDELTALTDQVNLRTATEMTATTTSVYLQMHQTRLILDQAIYGLRNFASTTPHSYIGELYALKGYVLVMFAELYCSGVPFSYVGTDGRVVLGHSRSTVEMLNDAVAQFDSALAAGSDSVRIQRLATVGKGRALLDLGQYADASAAVASVTPPFVSTMDYASPVFPSYWNLQSTAFALNEFVADREGGNGLDFVSAADPRLPLLQNGYSYLFTPTYVPANFATATTQAIPLATGVEAVLIRAEAALKTGDPSWLRTVNALRTTCPSLVGCATPAPVGSGGVAGLPPLADPGSDTARVSLLFRERAFWLFSTGHRTGDLRRMIRQYDRIESQLFPIGTNPFAFSPPSVYGVGVNLEPPRSERNNPNYTGCFNRDA